MDIISFLLILSVFPVIITGILEGASSYFFKRYLRKYDLKKYISLYGEPHSLDIHRSVFRSNYTPENNASEYYKIRKKGKFRGLLSNLSIGAFLILLFLAFYYHLAWK